MFNSFTLIMEIQIIKIQTPYNNMDIYIKKNKGGCMYFIGTGVSVAG